MLLVHISLCLVLILQKGKNAQTNFNLTSINKCGCRMFSLYLLLSFPGQVLFKQPSTLIMLRNRSSRSKHTFGFRPSIGNKMRFKYWFNRIRWLNYVVYRCTQPIMPKSCLFPREPNPLTHNLLKRRQKGRSLMEKVCWNIRKLPNLSNLSIICSSYGS